MKKILLISFLLFFPYQIKAAPISYGEYTTQILTISSDTSLSATDLKIYNIIEINAASGNITITLPSFSNIEKIINFIRTDSTNNIVKITGTDFNAGATYSEFQLDFFRNCQIYSSRSDNKWRINGNDEAVRRSTIKTKSSGIISIQDNSTSFITTNGDGTINITKSGVGEIIDRSSDPFNPTYKRFSWIATNNLDTNPTGQNGTFVVLVDESGTISVESLNSINRLQATSINGFNINNRVQLGTFTRTGTTFTALSSFWQFQGNSNNRINALMDTLGVLNSITDPVTLEVTDINLTMNVTSGIILSRQVGSLVGNGTNAPDIISVNAASTLNQILVNRNNSIISSSTNTNVTQYESPNGTFNTMTNNRYALRWYYYFPFSQFVGYTLGQAEYNDASSALNSNEMPDTPSILSGGVLLRRCAVLKNDTVILNANCEDL